MGPPRGWDRELPITGRDDGGFRRGARPSIRPAASSRSRRAACAFDTPPRMDRARDQAGVGLRDAQWRRAGARRNRAAGDPGALHNRWRKKPQEARHQAALEERNRIARDIHDTLTQGFAAILMQLQAAQRATRLPPAGGGPPRDGGRPGSTSLIEARRSVGTLQPTQTDCRRGRPHAALQQDRRS